MEDPRAPYGWADGLDGSFGFIYTVCLVSVVSPREALALAAPDARADPALVRDLRGWDPYPYGDNEVTWMLASPVTADWTLLVEPNGFRCSQIEPMSRLSGDGRLAVSVYRNVNALSRFTIARDGAVIRAFEPLFTPDTSTDGAPLPEEAGIAFPGEDEDDLRPMGSSLAVTERLTGIRLTAEHIEGDWQDRLAVPVPMT